MLKGGSIADPVLHFEKSPAGEQDAEVAVGQIGDAGQIREVMLIKRADGIRHLLKII
jgi:hypothetical protein